MFDRLDFDTLVHVCIHMRVCDVTSLLSVQKDMLQYDRDEFFSCFYNAWFSTEFIKKARERYYAERRTCIKYELCRIERFQKAVESCDGRRWKDADFFNLWAAERKFWRERRPPRAL